MPTMLLPNRARKLLAGLALLVGLAGSVFADGPCAWRVKVGKHPAVELNGKPVRLDRTMIAKLSAADEAAFLPVDIETQGGGRARWLVLRTPSRSRGGAGFCGAGHEDRLLLLEVRGARVKAAGEFLAQSCLSSISMDVDRLGELTEALNQDPKSGDLKFQQSISSEANAIRRTVTIKVPNGQVGIETQVLEGVK